MEARPDGSVLVSDTNNQRLRQIEDALPGEPPSGSQLILVPAEQGGVRYVFDNFGRHLRTEDAATGTVLLAFGYTSSGLLASATDAFGNATTVERDPGGTATAIVGPDGHRTTLTVGAPGGYLSAVENPEGERVGLAYTSDGLLTRLTGPRNFDTTFTWDALGRLERDADPLGGATILSRAELSATEEISGGWDAVRESVLGRRTTYRTERKRAGELVRTVTDPTGRVTVTVEGKDGSTRTTSPDGTVTEVTEGPDPRYGMAAPVVQSARMTTPGGLVVTTTGSRQASFVDPKGDLRNPANVTLLTETATVAGRTVTTVYDPATRRTTTTSPAGRQSITELDLLGRPIRTEAPGEPPVTFGYDARGRLSTVTQGSRVVTTTYGADGFPERVRDPLGRETSTTRDAVGRVLSRTLPDGRVVGFSYDPAGNLTSITPPSRPGHGFAYDADEQAQSATPPDLPGGPWATTWTYNLDHQVELVTRPDGRTIDPVYDPTSGRLTSVVTPRGATTYAYHPTSGQVTSIADPAGGSLAFAFDGSLPTGVTWAGEVAGSIGWTHNDALEVTSQTLNGTDPIAFGYDLDGLLTQAGDLTLTRAAATGFLTGTTLGQVAESFGYNAFGELASLDATVAGSPAYSVSFTRDAAGRITGKTETIGGTTSTYDYTFDLAGRLTDVEKDAAPFAHYDYDANSNRTGWTDPWGSGAATFDAQDRLLTHDDKTYTYTAAGELASKTQGGQTVTLDYDVSGALLGATLADGIRIDYVLDAADRRVGKKVAGTLVQGFLYEGGRIVAELDGSGAVVSRFVYGPQPHVPAYMIRAGVDYRILTDHLGSVRLVVNSADGTIAQRLDYDTFGRVLLDTSPGFQPFAFAGGLYDRQTGLLRFGARDYDPETGRWTAKDPIGFSGGDTNLYGYVLNDPVNGIDPSGEVAFFAVLAAAWPVVEAALTVFDIYDTISTVSDPCRAGWEKSLSVGGLAAGVLLPGGGYGWLSKRVVREGAGSTAKIYRAVSQAELDDIAEYGFRPGRNSMETKLFATSAEDASFWARDVLFPLDGEARTIVEVTVPQSVASTLYHGSADGRPIVGVGLDMFEALNSSSSVTVLNSMPIP